jgi:hypothetical protein
VVKRWKFFRKGYSYTGKLRVLSNILSNEYLYKEIRVKGGAYGGGAGFALWMVTSTSIPIGIQTSGRLWMCMILFRSICAVLIVNPARW